MCFGVFFAPMNTYSDLTLSSRALAPSLEPLPLGLYFLTPSLSFSFLRLSAPLLPVRLCTLVLSLLYLKVFRLYANLNLMYFDTKCLFLVLALQEFTHYAQGSSEDALTQSLC